MELKQKTVRYMLEELTRKMNFNDLQKILDTDLDTFIKSYLKTSKGKPHEAKILSLVLVGMKLAIEYYKDIYYKSLFSEN